MIMVEDPEKDMQKERVIEVRDIDELRELVKKLPEGTVYSLNLEVISFGQET